MANFVKLAEDYTRQIEKVWNELGLDISQQNERRLILYKKIDEGFKDFLTTETRELEELKKQLYEKNSELSRISNIINELCPAIIVSGRKLLEADAEVNEKLLAFKEIKAKREAHLRQLVSSARALDKDLGGDRLSLDVQFVSLDNLSQSRINYVTEVIHNLTKTKTDRQNKLMESIPEIIGLCSELEEPLPAPIEGAFTYSSDGECVILVDKLSVTEDAIAAVSAACVSLRTLREQRLSANSDLAERARSLARELPEKVNEIGLFLKEMSLVRPNSHKVLEDKVAELLMLRKDHKKKELTKYRESITDLWEEVDYPQAERVLPKIRPEAEAGDDINEIEIALSQYREVYEKLKAIKSEREPIIRLIVERKELVERRDTLEASTRDTSKYSSRSAADAAKVREEAGIKSMIDRKLPAKEKRLEELLKQWNENHGERFVYEGVDYLTKIKTDNENYKRHIEELKRIKKNQRLNSTSNKTVRGTAVPSRMAKSSSSAVHPSSSSSLGVPAKMAKSTGAAVATRNVATEYTTPKAEKRKLDSIFEKTGSSPIPHKKLAHDDNKELGNIDDNEK